MLSLELPHRGDFNENTQYTSFNIKRKITLKRRFLEFRMYHNFANLFYKLLESTFYMEMSKC